MKNIFITGIDTDIGKTFVSLGICLNIKSKGIDVAYFKPFQSGAYQQNETLKAPDVVEILKYCNIPCGYSYLLKGEVSPYLAAKMSNIEIDIKKATDDTLNFSKNHDFTVIEGAGGLYCPIYKDITFANFIQKLNTEILIVTTPDLGRINHTLMTIDCAKKFGIKIKGIIINKMPQEKTEATKHFKEELKAFCDVEILAIIPEMINPKKEEIISAFDWNIFP